jgi:hypothetical protein
MLVARVAESVTSNAFPETETNFIFPFINPAFATSLPAFVFVPT